MVRIRQGFGDAPAERIVIVNRDVARVVQVGMTIQRPAHLVQIADPVIFIRRHLRLEGIRSAIRIRKHLLRLAVQRVIFIGRRVISGNSRRQIAQRIGH